MDGEAEDLSESCGKWGILKILFGNKSGREVVHSTDGNHVIQCSCNHGRKVEVFCEDHEEISCEACKVINHVKCKTTSFKKKSSEYSITDLEETIRRTKCLSDKFENIQREGNVQLCELGKMKEVCKQDIKTFREEFNAFLDNLEKQILFDLDTCEDEQCQFIEERISSLVNKLHELESNRSTLEAAKKEGRNDIMFTLDLNISKNLQDHETFCEDIAKEIQAVTIMFAKNQSFEDIQKYVTTLGTLFKTEKQFQERRKDSIYSSSLEIDVDSHQMHKEIQSQGEQILQQVEEGCSMDQIRQIREQLQYQLLLLSRGQQASLQQKQQNQVRQNHSRKEKMRQEMIQQEKLRLEQLQNEHHELQKEQMRKEQKRQELLEKEQTLQEQMREKRVLDRKSGQEKIASMLQKQSEYEQNRQDTLREKNIRQEQSRQDQIREQQRLAKLRESQQEELRQKQMQQNELRKDLLKKELMRQKEIQEKQHQSRQEYLRQSHQEQVKQEQLRQEQLLQEQSRRERIRAEKIKQQQQEDELRREREALIRKEKALKEEARQEQLHQEYIQQEKIQEQQRQLREEQIRQLKEDQQRQKDLLKQLYNQIKLPENVSKEISQEDKHEAN